jgi:hypothetical protein
MISTLLLALSLSAATESFAALSSVGALGFLFYVATAGAPAPAEEADG